ncbi:MAG: hypothetical protein R2724_31645 [Bryobacterales bacterium]
MCFCVSIGALSAGQGIILKQSSEDLGSNKTTSTTSYIESDRVATSSTVDGKQMGFIYLADGNMMKMIDHSKKTVREMSGEDLEKMMGQVNEAMAKMQEQMKNMPPQQRAMMEKMMGGRMKEMMGSAAAKPVYKRAEGSAEIGGHPATGTTGSETTSSSRSCAPPVGTRLTCRPPISLCSRRWPPS